jgi:hypothetical protein
VGPVDLARTLGGMTDTTTDAGTGTPQGGPYRDIDTAPLGVKLLSMVVIIGAILDLSLATLMLLNASTSNLQAETGLTSGQLVAYSIGIGLIGLVAFAVGIGLRAGSHWARTVTIVLALIRLVGLAFAMIEFSSRQWYTALVPAIIYAVVAYYLLYDKEAREYYTA